MGTVSRWYRCEKAGVLGKSGQELASTWYEYLTIRKQIVISMLIWRLERVLRYIKKLIICHS